MSRGVESAAVVVHHTAMVFDFDSADTRNCRRRLVLEYRRSLVAPVLRCCAIWSIETG
jgi:hypothetical protein